jgi:hypothetical protein
MKQKTATKSIAKQKFSILDLINNRFVSIMFLPLQLYYTVVSYVIYYNEHKIMRDAINDDHELFDRLAKLKFYGCKRGYGLESYVEYTVEQGRVSDLQRNIEQNFRSMLDSIVIDYNLLGVTVFNVKPEHRQLRFKMELVPANKSMYYANRIDLIISAVITASIAAIIII